MSKLQNVIEKIREMELERARLALEEQRLKTLAASHEEEFKRGVLDDWRRSVKFTPLKTEASS